MRIEDKMIEIDEDDFFACEFWGLPNEPGLRRSGWKNN